MKKIIIKTLLILSITWLISFGFVQSSYAADWDSWSDSITVTVTEKIPWANCTPEEGKPVKNDAWEEIWRTYDCKVGKGFSSVVEMMWAIIKYFTFLAGLGWVLYIVINGIMYSMGGMDQSMKDESKKRVQKTIIWLVLLFLSWVLLNIIAPWIYK